GRGPGARTPSTARPPAPFDRSHGRIELHRQPRRELCQQRAEALAAESIDVALGGAREVQRRNLRQILAAAEGAEKELNCRAPLAEVLRQRLRARHVALA